MNKANASKKIVALIAVVMLVAILAVCLVACNQKDYEKRLDDAGYTVISISAEKLGVDKEDVGIDWAINGTKASLTGGVQNVTVVKFVETNDAKDFAKKFEDSKTTVVKRSGKIVIYGTEQGVKDAQ